MNSMISDKGTGQVKDFYKLAAAMLVAYIQGSTVWVILPLYLKSVGISNAENSVIMSVSGLVGIFSGIIAGKVADIIGRKPIIVTGLLGYAIPWVIFWQTKSIPFFYLARVIDGITLQMFFTAVYAFISDVFPGEKRGRAQGIYQSAANIGSAIGPVLLVGLVYNTLGPDIYWIVCIFIFLISGSLVFLFVNESKRDVKKASTLFVSLKNLSNPLKNSKRKLGNAPSQNKPLTLYLLSSIIRSIGQTMLLPLFSLYLLNLGLSVTETSIIYSVTSMVNIATPTVFGLLSDKFGRKRILVLGIVASAITSLLFIWVQTFFQVLVVRLLSTVAMMITVPIGLAFLTDLLPPSGMGLGIGFYQSILRIDSTVMGVVGGAFVQLYGFNAVFIVGCLTSLISAGIIQAGIPESAKSKKT